MTREEAIEIINGLYFNGTAYCPKKEIKEFCEIIIKALEQEPRWIPVSERLPEENGYYLTTTMYHEVYCDYWEEERFNRTEAVIAWMPLPEPYREVEE